MSAESPDLYPWRVVALCCVVGAVNYADRTAIASVYPLLRADLALSDIELAGIGSFFLFTYALASPLAGILADRVSRSRMIFWSLAGWSLITLLTGLVTSISQLLFTRALLGLFEAAYIPAAIGLIADYHDSRTRATAIGIHSTAFLVGVVGGGSGFGYLGDHYGWRPGFLILGAGGLILAAIVRGALRDPPAGPPREHRAGPGMSLVATFTTLLRVPSFLLLLVTNVCVGLGHWIFLNWLPLYYQETYHLSLAGAGFRGTVMVQGAGVVAGLAGSVFSDRVAARAPARRMLIQASTGLLAAPFLLVFFWSRPSLALLNACVFAFSFAVAFGACNATPLICELLPPPVRSTAIGIGNALNCLVGGVGVLLSGFLKSTIGLAGVFGGISGVTLLSSLLLAIGYGFFVRRDLAATGTTRHA